LNNVIGVSLSGGVDSMVITYILKQMELMGIIKQVVAVHIYYGNRIDSMDETLFIKDWCNYYNIPLIIKYIAYMTRDVDMTDRNFYEEETKRIRFNTYKFAQKMFNISGFCLGHHQDDLIENIFMNILKGRDILDLCVMHETSIINDVLLLRPYLYHTKKYIFDFAHKYYIPYTF